METSMNVTCAEIQISDGFEYRVPADRFTLFQQFDCESLWFSQDNRLLADPVSQKLMDPVISVSSDRLLTSRCVDELRHQIHCDTSAFTLDTIFRVRNGTAVTPNSGSSDVFKGKIGFIRLHSRSDHPRIGSVNRLSELVQCPDADHHLVV
ncbi:hypothetical protein Q8A67_001533 [Cirrhinus molitorella]|uniref:Uncharacterized protein n=1 Tax=Cirrhinus molitorella TaxID=172907 RepID=A0AA88QLH2_9TELE|nr:hypothetical protein Q8A67_001533 [Cirrhinus molitorella]